MGGAIKSALTVPDRHRLLRFGLAAGPSGRASPGAGVNAKISKPPQDLRNPFQGLPGGMAYFIHNQRPTTSAPFGEGGGMFTVLAPLARLSFNLAKRLLGCSYFLLILYCCCRLLFGDFHVEWAILEDAHAT